MNDLDAFMDSISGDGLYNTARAQQLGYTKDESGHLPSVDHKTGDWLKSKKHPTAFMELYEYATNPHIQKKLNHPVVNIDGHFGKDQLTYPKRYADGGPVLPAVQNTAVTESTAVQLKRLPDMYFQKAATTRRPEKMSLIDNAAVEEDTTVERLYKKYLPENKQEVKTIQRELQTKGYDIGKRGVDGYFGDDTKRAYESAKRNIPDLSKEIERKECSEDGCAAYVTNTLKGRVLGDAWEMMDNIRKSGGKIKYNIYEDSRFDSVKDTEQLKKVTSQVKADSKAKKDMFEIGDVVGLYNAQSDYHEVARTKGKGGAKNTHVGLVTDIRNGIPVISHNIKGKLHHDNFNNLTIAWIGADAGHKEFHVKGASEQVEDMVLKSAEQMSKALNMKISPEQVSKDVYGILKTETGAGKNVPSEMTEKRSTLARQVLGLGDKGNVSSGIAKIKGNTLSPKEKAFTGFDGKSETVGDDIKATTYLYLKHLNEAQRYAEKNPELGLSQEDIRDMAILGHNQGMSKLLNLGANSVNMTKQEEVEKLRQLREGRIRDISSTNYRFAERVGLGRLGQYLYDKEFPEGHESYVSRVRKHGADLDAFMDSILKK